MLPHEVALTILTGAQEESRTMITPPTTADFPRIVVEQRPLIDVRAPVEFVAGAFPGAVNLPILNDEERHRIGLCYKQQGKKAAFELADSIVSGEIRERRIAAWLDFYHRHPNALLYCFRGGMRSKTAQEWLLNTGGEEIVRLEGGYKAFRNFLLDALRPEAIAAQPVILGGRTGTGKTLLLHELNNSIDLEAIANHRGSAFGCHLSPQPTQIDFENRLAYALIRHLQRGYHYLILEDEGNHIGARYIPHALVQFFKQDTLVLLECELAERIELTFKEYVVDAQREYEKKFGVVNGSTQWLEFIHSRMYRIRKRLGGERLARVNHFLAEAHALQQATGERSGHKRWIALLLTEYYDPMYDYQIKKSGRRIIFRGGFPEVRDYLANLENR